MSRLTDLLQTEMTVAYSKLLPVNVVTVDTWWRLAKFGDKKAHGNLIVVCYPIALRIYKLLNLPRDHMDDCVSEGLMAVRSAVKSYRPDETHQSFRSWAHRYIRTAMLRETSKLLETLRTVDLDTMSDRIEQIVLHPEVAPHDDSPAYTQEEIDSFPFIECDIDRQQEADELRYAIDSLPAHQKALMRYVVNGHNVLGACAIIGISRQAGYILYASAINGLREWYKII